MKPNHVQTKQEPTRSVPRWLQKILEWRAGRRKKELAKLDAELSGLKRELAAIEFDNEKLRQHKFVLGRTADGMSPTKD